MEFTSKKLEVAARYFAGVMVTAASIAYLHSEVDNMLNPKPIITEFNELNLHDSIKVQYLKDIQSDKATSTSPKLKFSIIDEIKNELNFREDWVTKEGLTTPQEIAIIFSSVVCKVYQEKTNGEDHCVAFPREEKTVLIPITKESCDDKSKVMHFESCDAWVSTEGSNVLTIVEPRYL